MPNARVPDEEIFYRDPNIHHVESSVVHYQLVWKTKLPRWCREGLTMMQRRRMQRERRKICIKKKILLSLKIGSNRIAKGKVYRQMSI